MRDQFEETVEALEKYYDDFALKFAMKKNLKRNLEIKLKSKEEELGKIEKKIDILEQVRILLQRASEYAREQIKQQIEMLVTHCLQFVFGPALEFKIELNEIRGKADAEFYVISTFGDVQVKTKPQDARGGGIVDVIALALRIAVIQSTNFYSDGPLILDEPAKHVSSEYIGNVAQFLKQISEVFHRQIIMITHNQYLSEIADIAYRVELKEGTSVVTLYNP
ncbi:MAG: ATPase [Tepidanaerobacteraceae bacterium]|jgi:DNA repair exonuclease SbcCD ATPase subunit|nr:ATPase [Tepidanaerobacteraceae bacterium]